MLVNGTEEAPNQQQEKRRREDNASGAEADARAKTIAKQKTSNAENAAK
jgi:hypothetical protein